MNKALFLFLFVHLSGCSMVEGFQPKWDKFLDSPSTARYSSPVHQLVETVIANKAATPYRATLGLHRYEALYLGATNGCDHVSVTNIEFNRHKNYKKCGQTITEASEPAPSLPRNYPQVQFAITQNIQHAYLNRTSRQLWEGYLIDSVQVGPPRANGCAQIFTKITHNQMLVKTSLDTVCQ